MCVWTEKVLELCGTGNIDLSSSIAQVLVLSDSGHLCEPWLFSREMGISAGLQGSHFKLQPPPRWAIVELIGRIGNFGL